jgi:hypothetical protein
MLLRPVRFAHCWKEPVPNPDCIACKQLGDRPDVTLIILDLFRCVVGAEERSICSVLVAQADGREGLTS